MLPAFLLGLLVLTAAAAALIVVGFRGRKLNDHPVCAQCRFDLEGVYPECMTCPECGAGLKRDRSVLQGARRRMPFVIAGGFVLLVTAVLPVGFAGYTAVTGGDVNKLKPLGWLLWEAGMADRARAEKLAAEVMSRILAGTVDDQAYQQVIRKSLAMQSNREKPWVPVWGDFIERAKFDGKLSESEEDEFLRNSARFELVTRPAARVGAMLPAMIRVTDVRLGSNMSLPCPAQVRAANLDGIDIKVGNEEGPFDLGTFGLSGGTGRARRMMYDRNASGFELPIPADFKIGNHELSVEVVVAPGTNPPSSGFSIIVINGRVQKQASNKSKLEGHVLELSRTIEILESNGEPTVQPLSPDADRIAQLERQLRPTLLRRGSSMGGGFVDDGVYFLEFPLSGIPDPVAYDVLIRNDRGESLLGSLVSGLRIDRQSGAGMDGLFSMAVNGGAPGGANPSAATVGARLSSNPGERVTVVLRPRAELAESTVDQQSYVDRELVFEDVPVEPPPPDPFQEMNRRMEEMLRGRFPR